MGAPSEATPQQLRELSLRVAAPPKAGSEPAARDPRIAAALFSLAVTVTPKRLRQILRLDMCAGHDQGERYRLGGAAAISTLFGVVQIRPDRSRDTLHQLHVVELRHKERHDRLGLVGDVLRLAALLLGDVVEHLAGQRVVLEADVAPFKVSCCIRPSIAMP